MTAENQNITIDRISIQVALSGYSFKVQSRDGSRLFSEWHTSDKVFVTKEFQSRYDAVEIALFTPKAALFPQAFFNAADSRRLLSDVVRLSEEDSVESIQVPEFGAVLVYSNAVGETLSKAIASSVLRTDGYKSPVLPEMYFILKALHDISDYNKIVASYADGRLYVAVAQGKTLLLCNSFEAQDFTTAEYFLFMVLKKLQLNPEVSSVYFRTPVSDEMEMSLYHYFSSVERI